MLLRGLPGRWARDRPALIGLGVAAVAGVALIGRHADTEERRQRAAAEAAARARRSAACMVANAAPAGQQKAPAPSSRHAELGSPAYARGALWLPMLFYQCLVSTAALIRRSTWALASRLALARHQPALAERRGQPAGVTAAALAPFEGTWSKDFGASGPLTDFMELFAVPAIVRKAAFLMRGMRIHVEGAELHVTMLCALPWLSRTEVFPLDGSAAAHKRRDMRRGSQHGSVSAAQPPLPAAGAAAELAAGPAASSGAGTSGITAVRLHITWPEPYAGEAWDELTVAGDKLRVSLRARVGEGEASSHAVYRRRHGGVGASDAAPAA